jgi:hypothetical protein
MMGNSFTVFIRISWIALRFVGVSVAFIATLLWIRSEFFTEGIMRFPELPTAGPSHISFIGLEVNGGSILAQRGRFEFPKLTGTDLGNWLNLRTTLPSDWKHKTLHAKRAASLSLKLRNELFGFAYWHSADEMSPVWAPTKLKGEQSQIRFPIWPLIAMGLLPWITSGIRKLMQRIRKAIQRGHEGPAENPR